MTVGLNRPGDADEHRRLTHLYKKRVVTRPVEPLSPEARVPINAKTLVERINSNPLVDKDDMTTLLSDLLAPLEASQSLGGARIKLGHSGAGFDPVASELEGYARALWGLGPLLASEPDHPLFGSLRSKWVRGLINGTDPNHTEYWGDCQDRDQRLVEQAAIVSHAPS